MQASAQAAFRMPFLSLSRLIAALVLVPGAIVGQDVITVRWRLSPDGALQVQCPTNFHEGAFTYADWEPMFPDWKQAILNRDPRLVDDIYAVGPFCLAPLVLHGPGGACALDESSRRLEKLGIDRSVFAFTSALQGGDLVDLLRIKDLGANNLLSATYALEDYASSANRDDFVRAAALAELASRASAARPGTQQPARRDGLPSADLALGALPDGWSWVAGLDCSRAPSLHPWFAIWRDLSQRLASTWDVQGGGSLSPQNLARAQVAMDMPGQLPAELGRLFGNWRVDYLVAAGYERDALAILAQGEFRLAEIKRGLASLSVPFDGRDDQLVRFKAMGFDVSATSTAVAIAGESLAEVRRGSDLPRLLELARSGTCWLAVDELTRLGMETVPGTSMTAVLRDGVVHGSVRGKGAKEAGDWWRKLCSDLRIDPDVELSGGSTIRDVLSVPRGCREHDQIALAWRRAMHAIVLDQEDEGLDWRWNISAIPDIDIMRVLALWPTQVPQFLNKHGR